MSQYGHISSRHHTQQCCCLVHFQVWNVWCCFCIAISEYPQQYISAKEISFWHINRLQLLLEKHFLCTRHQCTYYVLVLMQSLSLSPITRLEPVYKGTQRGFHRDYPPFSECVVVCQLVLYHELVERKRNLETASPSKRSTSSEAAWYLMFPTVLLYWVTKHLGFQSRLDFDLRQ